MAQPSKVLFYVFALISISITNADPVDVTKSIHDRCVEQYPIDEAFIEEARKGEFSDEPNFKCYIQCITTGYGVMDEDGIFTVNENQLAGLGSDPKDFEVMIQNVKTCNEKADATDLCERAHQFNKCTYEINSDLYVIF